MGQGGKAKEREMEMGVGKSEMTGLPQ